MRATLSRPLLALTLLALAACNSNIPKSCRNNPKGFECRDYHRSQSIARRAERERDLAANPQKRIEEAQRRAQKNKFKYKTTVKNK